ncbi:hypothetical protein BDFG_01269 [Blastomyces dermatitidis ATCC 26199]|nr:hypothetical protein BDFG_01269 [Blastomyces dermatitidis ATCC 26199]
MAGDCAEAWILLCKFTECRLGEVGSLYRAEDTVGQMYFLVLDPFPFKSFMLSFYKAGRRLAGVHELVWCFILGTNRSASPFSCSCDRWVL